MTIPELMKIIENLFPRAFANQEALKYWTGVYRKALGHKEGLQLAEAWDRTIINWTKPGYPKPGDIFANIPKSDSTKPEGGPVGAECRDRLHPTVIARTPLLAEFFDMLGYRDFVFAEFYKWKHKRAEWEEDRKRALNPRIKTPPNWEPKTIPYA